MHAANPGQLVGESSAHLCSHYSGSGQSAVSLAALC